LSGTETGGIMAISRRLSEAECERLHDQLNAYNNSLGTSRELPKPNLDRETLRQVQDWGAKRLRERINSPEYQRIMRRSANS